MLLVIALVFVAPYQVLADRLELRDGAPPLSGRAVVVDDSGVQFRSRGAETRFFTWDRVRALETDSMTMREAFHANREIAEIMWRARARLERGDAALAEPLFEQLFEGMKGRTDATAMVATEGLLRCRLARGSRASAVIPWLETLRMRIAGVERTAYLELPEVIDASSGLCPLLPPVWLNEPATMSLVDDLTRYVPVDSPEVERLAEWYRVSAARATGAPPPWPEEGDSSQSSNGPGLNLALGTNLVSAFCRGVYGRDVLGEMDSRIFARFSRETERLAAWAHFGRGHALLNSATTDEILQGLLDLLTVPGLLARDAPFLAGLALHDAARELDEMGRHEAARSLERELSLRFPHHPINRAADSTARSNGA